MAITFESLEELKEFYRTFCLSEVQEGPYSKRSSQSHESFHFISESPRQTELSADEDTEEESDENFDEEPSLTGASQTVKTERKQRRRANGGQTMTSMVEETIQKYLNKEQSFTANDVYAMLSKKDDSINKQSVITSVLKQMNTIFTDVAVTERPGRGPRPVKLYNA